MRDRNNKTDTQTHRQTDGWASDGRTDGQTDRQRQREREREREQRYTWIKEDDGLHAGTLGLVNAHVIQLLITVQKHTDR